MKRHSLLFITAFALFTCATLNAQNADKAARKKQPARTKRQRAPRIAPTHANIKYGPHPRNVFDMWLAESDKPTPLVIYYHGGGFRGGDKRTINTGMLQALLNKGVSVAAANYRLTNAAI